MAREETQARHWCGHFFFELGLAAAGAFLALGLLAAGAAFSSLGAVALAADLSLPFGLALAWVALPGLGFASILEYRSELY